MILCFATVYTRLERAYMWQLKKTGNATISVLPFLLSGHAGIASHLWLLLQSNKLGFTSLTLSRCAGIGVPMSQPKSLMTSWGACSVLSFSHGHLWRLSLRRLSLRRPSLTSGVVRELRSISGFPVRELRSVTREIPIPIPLSNQYRIP